MQELHITVTAHVSSYHRSYLHVPATALLTHLIHDQTQRITLPGWTIVNTSMVTIQQHAIHIIRCRIMKCMRGNTYHKCIYLAREDMIRLKANR